MEIEQNLDGIIFRDEFGEIHFNNDEELMRTLRYGKDRFDKEQNRAKPIYMSARGSGKTIRSLARTMDEICNRDDLLDAMRYCYNDILSTKYICGMFHNPNEIKNVIFNNPATIVFWEDGTKTVVKCDKDEKFDPEKGLAMAISKRFLGDKGNYYNEFKKWLPETTFESTTVVDTMPTEIKFGAVAMPSLDDMMKNLNTSINDSIKNIRIG